MAVKPSIRKQDNRWVLTRPGYGFNPATVEPFDSWREAADSLRTAPASAGPLVEQGHHWLSLSGSFWGPSRGTIRMGES